MSTRAILILASIIAIVVGGCGGSSTATHQNAEARFLSLAEGICRDAHTTKATGATFIAHQKAQVAQLRALESAVRRIPHLDVFIADLSARRRLRGTMLKAAATGHSAPHASSRMEQAYRLALKIRRDEKALGLRSCIGAPPRAPIGG